jgi:hypothetical protein
MRSASYRPSLNSVNSHLALIWRLTNECLKVFDGWLHHYLFGALPEKSEILEYRDLLKDAGVL